jgi:ubiquinol-cytochrome c reductase cytochrome b subunit
MVNGFAGYSLLDDQLSGTGLRIGYGVALSVPVVGTWIASLFFGGEFPGPDLISRLYVLHILIIPVTIAVLLTLHLGIVIRHRHTQFPGPGRRDDNVVGTRLWPTYASKALGLFFIVAAVLSLLGGLFQINPVWIFGPFNTAQVSAASQPDWYMGWLDGALRIMPGWETRFFGFEIPEPFYPGALLGGITFMLLYAWPFLEARVTGDYAEHHLLDRPRQRPVRTALGAATLSFYAICFFGAASDIIASTFQLSVNRILVTFRVAVIVVPILTAWITYRLCRELAARDGVPTQSKVRFGQILGRLLHGTRHRANSPTVSSEVGVTRGGGLEMADD